MNRNIKRLSCTILFLLFLISSASAHSGRTDANGGHYNRKTGEYHYHNSGRRSAPPATRETYSSPKKTPQAPAPVALEANGMYYVRVVRVIDGDTIEVAFSETRKEKVRLIGVDTPETVHPKKAVQRYGKEASDYTKKELADKKVWLQLDVQVRDKYQRLLGYVWMEKPNDVDSEDEIRAKMFNAGLLLEGYAQTMTIQPNSKYSDLFVKLQSEAREGKNGLWK